MKKANKLRRILIESFLNAVLVSVLFWSCDLALFVREVSPDAIPRQISLAYLDVCSSRCLPAILSAYTDRQSFFGRRIVDEKFVKKIGNEAHQLILERLKTEKSYMQRMKYFHLLQCSFGDYRYLKEWLVLVENKPNFRSWLQDSFDTTIGDHRPDIFVGLYYTDEFVNWYEKNKDGLRLPPIDFYKSEEFVYGMKR